MSDLLLVALGAAVPLCIAELQALQGDTRWLQAQQWAARAVEAVAHRGDVLQFGGGRKGEAAGVFADLARGLAALAHAPGGVLFCGTHWCLDHRVGIRCASVGDLTCATSGFDADIDVEEMPRPVVTLEVLAGVL